MYIEYQVTIIVFSAFKIWILFHKLTSKTKVMRLKTNFAQLPRIPEKSFMSKQSKTNCKRLSTPPLQSKMTFHILNPVVILIYVLHRTYCNDAKSFFFGELYIIHRYACRTLLKKSTIKAPTFCTPPLKVQKYLWNIRHNS